VQSLENNLVVAVTSSNTTLLPNANITITQPTSAGAASFVYTLVSGQAGTTTVTLSVTDEQGLTATSSFTITQTAPLAGVISAVPVTVCYGNNNGSISINGSTGGAGSYQYSINGTTWQSSNSFAALTAGTYQVSMRDAANTSCVIDLDGLTGTTISQPTIISATAAPITTPICTNQNAQFTITGNAGGIVTYNFNGGTNATATIGSNGTVIVTAVAVSTTSILNLVSSTIGACTSNISGSATVVVNPIPAALVTLNDQSLCAGEMTTAVTFASVFNVSGTTYTWTNSNANIGLVASGAGNIGAFTATNTTNANISGTITVTPATNGCLGTPATFVITVRTIPTANDPTNQVVCNGAVVPATNLTGNLSGTVFNWTNNTTSIGLPAQGTGTVQSFTAVNSGTAPVTATITVTPTNQFSYTIYQTHGGNAQTNQYPDYAMSAAEMVNMLDISNSNTTVWSAGTANPSTLLNWNGASALTAAGISFPLSGDYFAVKVTGTFVPAETGVYSFGLTGDDGVDLSIDGSVIISYYGGHGATPTYYANYNMVAGQVYSIMARHQEYGGGEAFMLTWKRPSQSSYSVQPTELAGCTGIAQTYTITVNPTPVVAQPTSQTVCAGASFAETNFTSASIGTTYSWTSSNSAVGLAANGNGNIPTFVATNTTIAPISTTVTVTPTYGPSCTGASKTFTLTVNPGPIVSTAQTETICSGTSFNITPSNGGGNIVPSNISYAWSAPSVTGITGAAASTGATSISGTLTNTTSSPIKVLVKD
jgi:hypothetical protein